MTRRELVSLEDPRARNLALTVEYDGSGFSGWQLQPGTDTVQGVLEQALAVVCRHPVVLRVAGRTDAGVHAWAQRAHFYSTAELSCDRILRGVNALAGGGVKVVAVDEMPLDWDARRDATGKIYVYRILARPEPSALLAGRVWHVPWPLDLSAMEAELVALPGHCDWSAFCAADGSDPNTVKDLRSVTLSHEPHEVLALHFEGSGFLKQMVRILVGTLVEVGLHKRQVGSMVQARNSGLRTAAGRTAPADGLYLEQVLYD